MISYKEAGHKHKTQIYMKQYVKNTFIALRLPFTAASILPFLAGSFMGRDSFNALTFALGLAAVVFTHLGANLINDYADSRSGVDWRDKRPHIFFGGSKLIQAGILSEKWYLTACIICFTIAFFCAFLLAGILKSLFLLIIYLIILALSLIYSISPVKLSYRGLGELTVFLLFGPAAVMGGYFIQTGIFLSPESFFVSLPFGFFTCAILFTNEIPDFEDDASSGKFTLVSLFGKNASRILYIALVSSGFLSIAACVTAGYVSFFSALSFLTIPLFIKAFNIIKTFPEKTEFQKASRLIILSQSLIGIILVIGAMI